MAGSLFFGDLLQPRLALALDQPHPDGAVPGVTALLARTDDRLAAGPAPLLAARAVPQPPYLVFPPGAWTFDVPPARNGSLAVRDPRAHGWHPALPHGEELPQESVRAAGSTEGGRTMPLSWREG